MTFWLDLFTTKTWAEFVEQGGTISGFREGRRTRVDRVQPGDILLCYVTVLQRWVGALKVVARHDGNEPIWSSEAFPLRFQVEPLVQLAPRDGVPMRELEGLMAFYSSPAMKGKYNGFLRGSPTRFTREADGELLLGLLKERAAIDRPSSPSGGNDEPRGTRHLEIQHLLLSLGVELGQSVWIAKNDRHRVWRDVALGETPGVVQKLPEVFNSQAQAIIELIDVIWLRNNSITAAFEVEATTSVYSGLLRMSDLVAVQPNINVDLFIVAPEDRRAKVQAEIRRPTFAQGHEPLAKRCGFIDFDKLVKKVHTLRDLDMMRLLQANRIRDLAEYF